VEVIKNLYNWKSVKGEVNWRKLQNSETTPKILDVKRDIMMYT